MGNERETHDGSGNDRQGMNKVHVTIMAVSIALSAGGYFAYKAHLDRELEMEKSVLEAKLEALEEERFEVLKKMLEKRRAEDGSASL